MLSKIHCAFHYKLKSIIHRNSIVGFGGRLRYYTQISKKKISWKTKVLTYKNNVLNWFLISKMAVSGKASEHPERALFSILWKTPHSLYLQGKVIFQSVYIFLIIVWKYHCIALSGKLWALSLESLGKGEAGIDHDFSVFREYLLHPSESGRTWKARYSLGQLLPTPGV